MKRIALTGILICILGVTSAIAAEVVHTGRIDMVAKTPGATLSVVSKAKGIGGGYQGWIKDEDQKNRSLYFSKILKDDEWHRIEVTFQSDTDTEVELTLRGAYEKDESGKVMDVWSLYDDFEVQGAELKNAGFEDVEMQERYGAEMPVGWRTASKDKPERQAQVAGADKARTGDHAARAAVYRAFSTDISIKADQPVTVSVWVKRDN